MKKSIVHFTQVKYGMIQKVSGSKPTAVRYILKTAHTTGMEKIKRRQMEKVGSGIGV